MNRMVFIYYRRGRHSSGISTKHLRIDNRNRRAEGLPVRWINHAGGLQ